MTTYSLAAVVPVLTIRGNSTLYVIVARRRGSAAKPALKMHWKTMSYSTMSAL